MPNADIVMGVTKLSNPRPSETTPAVASTAGDCGTDENLMRRYAGGDAGAFDTLYERHKGPVYRYILRNVGDRASADELFQDIWLRLIRGRHKYQSSAQFTTWLFTLSRNRVIDHYRRRRPTGPMPADVAAPDHEQPEARLSQTARAARLRAAVAALPFDQRDAFLLKEERGLTLAQIATISGVGRETVKSRLRYALSKLREVLRDEHA